MSKPPTAVRAGQLRDTQRIPAKHTTHPIGSFTLRLYWTPDAHGLVLLVGFELFEIVGHQADDESAVCFAGGATIADMTEDLDEAEPVASGFAKWDGCTQFEVAPVHVDDLQGLENLFHGISEARRRCALAMAGTDIATEYQTRKAETAS